MHPLFSGSRPGAAVDDPAPPETSAGPAGTGSAPSGPAHDDPPSTTHPHVPSQRGASPLETTRSTIHREPVVTLDGRVVGYVVTVTLENASGPVAADVLHAHYMALDLPNVVADRYVFLPATPAMLDGYVPAPVVPDRLVLDLPPGFEHTADAVPRAAALRALGVQLALGSYRGELAQEALLPHVGFVVVDPRLPNLPLPAVVHHLHGYGCRVLAEHVVTPQLADACRAAGVDGLRGGQAERGEISASGTRPVEGTDPHPRVLRAGELQCLALMHLLSMPEVDFDEVAQVVDTDPVLTLRVLHLVNSGAFALTNEIDTVHQAIILLGVREVTTLVSALLVDARPDAMDSLWFILARALTCEQLADDLAAYTVGMLSALAAQLGVPPEAILEKVGVSPLVADAVRDGAGPLGAALTAAKAHERSDAEGVVAAGFDPTAVSATYISCLADALATARTVTRSPSF